MQDHSHWRSDRSLLFLALLAVTAFEIVDMIGDMQAGDSLFHLAGEGTISLAALLGAVWLGVQILKLRAQNIEQINTITNAHEALSAAKAEANQWRSEASGYLLGLSQAIDGQFQRWGLTQAEKDIGLLLLKGLSLKEIAALRNVSEKTARAQSLAIYSKSGLKGRAELSAFFLEDLLLPLEKSRIVAVKQSAQ